MTTRIVAMTCIALAFFLPACGDTGVSPDSGPGSGMDGDLVDTDAGTADTDAGLEAIDGSIAFGTTQCSNGVDDDGDGDVDGADQECTGPADDDEGSFGTGLPGDNRDPFCQDCFFDGNSGPGDDRCRYATACLTTGDPSGAPGGCATCEASAECVERCQAATPNGCDCFGCCEVHLDDGSTVDILLGGSCSIENIEDTTACPRCVQTDTCENTCGRCELCLGRTAADLPADCIPDGGNSDGGVPYVCEGGQVPCGPSGSCDVGFYCQLGCCLRELI